MAQFFSIDSFGQFKIIANKLTESMSPYGNGTFRVPILIHDFQGCTNLVTINVQMSKMVTQSQCPKISDSAICQFSINQTYFDTSKLINLYFFSDS